MTKGHYSRRGNKCIGEGCDNPVWARQMCRKHYYRWSKHGDPDKVLIKQSPAGVPMGFLNSVPMEGVGCVRWPFATNNQGYAQINIGPGTKKALVSRIVCERKNGPPPSPTHQAAHSCGKGHEACIAPWHLSWKTPKENSADMLLHGTRHRDQASKLTSEIVMTIRSLEGTDTQKRIGAKFGVCQTMVGLIFRRERWGHLNEGSA